MSKVTLVFEQKGEEKNYDPVLLTVKVDGVVVGGGRIGGEPEDNSRARDYAWIQPLIVDIVKKLGVLASDIEVEEVEDF